MYILYSKGTSVTGKALKNALGIAGGTNPPADRQDHLIRWGSSVGVARRPENYHNSKKAVASATDKLGSMALMRERNVSIPDVLRQFDPRSIPNDLFPLLGRRINHTQGRDIVLCMQREDVIRAVQQQAVDYLVRYVPTSREFRVHVFDGEVIKISEKLLTEPEKFSSPWVRNYKNGYTFRNPREITDVLRSLVETQAIAAVQAHELKFGAVDVIVGDNGQVFVLEVNTGPALSDNSLEIYARKLADALGIPQENLNLPDGNEEFFDEDVQDMI